MSKISELTDGGSLLPTDFLIAVRSGGNVKVKADQADFDRIRLGDNEKIELGNNQDLQIYHDGSHSYIKDTGTGDLRVYAQDFQIRNADGSNTMLYANAPTGGIQLFHTGAEKLATSASGISVTGTVTADGLTVDTSATGGFKVEDRGAEGAGVKVTAYQGTTNSNVRQLDVDAYQLTVSTGPVTGATVTDRLLIADNGDISFYEDTGTTPKFFWDASAESLGIGTSLPASGLELEGVGNSTNITLDNTTASTGRSYSIRSGNTGNLDFYDNDATNARMVIDASGNVGIGTPTITSGFKLEVTGDARFGDAVGDDAVELGWSAGGSQGFIQAYDRGASAFRPLNINNSLTVDASGQLSAVSASNVRLTLGSEGTVGNNSSNWIRGNSTSLQFNNAGGGFMWEAIGSEKMRLDAGGSLLIGKTTPADLHNTWNHIIIGEKGAIISENGAGGIDGITLADNAYIDSDTGTYAYQTTAAASLIRQSGGVTQFSNAASGSAGAALTPVVRMQINADGKTDVGGVANQTTAVLNARFNGAAIEFGHGNNGAGYYGTAGSYGNNGQPYIGFSCDGEESANTFTTRGAKGNIITGDLSGNLTFAQVTTASATGQTPANRMTLDASGNLLVGTTDTDPANNSTNSTTDDGAAITAVGEVRSSRYLATANSGAVGFFNRTGTDGDIVRLRKSGTTVGSWQSRAGVVSTIVLNPASGNGAGLSGGTKTIVPADEAGIIDNDISLGISSHRFKDLYLSGGVVFGATGGAVTSKTLDDYEEGTWTPAYDTSSSNATVAYTTQRGKYTKVGNLVYITWYLEIGTVTSAGTGSIQITGVPFQAETGNDSRGADAFYKVNWDSANYNHPVSYLPSAAASAVQYLMTRDNGTWTVGSTSTLAIATGDVVSGSMTFRV